MADRQIELTWRCSSCGHRNLGRHLACTSCGNPKDDSEAYEMPDDPARVASVTDPRLLAQATAGANWRCPFCGSDVRARDGSCAQCGAAQTEGGAVARRRVVATPLRAAPSARPRRIALLFLLPLVALFACGAGMVLFARGRPRPPPPVVEPEFRDVDATVASASWKCEVRVERYGIVDKTGFAEQKPKDATNVKPLGERVHHVDKVQEGTTTETYTDTVTEMESESYSEQEQCGQDCRTLPQSCHEVCTNNQNGFASCHTECSGGGQSCSPKYCQVQKTRMAPKSKQVEKTRVVPKMVDVPRMAPYFAWKQWDWHQDRTLEEHGSDFAPHWPSDERIALAKNLGKGQQERAVRSEQYRVELASPDGAHQTVYPATRDAYAKYQNATVTLRVHGYGGVEIVKGP